ncbi:hypothetical protein [Aureispira anguillae]|uniref:Uncharacterized protein n=1 Tax=Aureispira anguillae TaxID=2864201 RepID=A0A915VJW2_9BACT|nr:hypothetical protein [Aureispira anguillae]BDS09382.1 hypothetical protein AsAng_0000800 [Aureispira anguillae]
MKSNLILFFCLLSIQWSLAQNISGRWEGYLDQSSGASSMDGYKDYWERGLWKKGTKTHDLQLTFKYNEKKKSYTGEYYINEAIKKAHFARFAIKASVFNQKVRYSTTSKIFETKNTLNLGFCYNQATLNWSEDGKYEYLEGKWRGWNDDKRSCAPAHIWVRRRKRNYSPPPKPPVVVAKKPVPPPSPVVKKEEPIEPLDKVDTVEILTVDSIAVDTVHPKPPVVPNFNNRKLIVKETIHVPKDSIWIHVWDSNREDGDIISLEFNGQLILKKYTLSLQKKGFRVALNKGENVLTLIAHNLGEIPPNTAAVEIEREEGKKLIVLESDMDSSELIKIIRE